MRTFLRRWRWSLSAAALSSAVLFVAAHHLAVDLDRSEAFDRVQVGMRPIQAHRILMNARAEDLGTHPDWKSLNSHKYAFYLATDYMLGNDIVEIVWDKDGSVFKKRRTRVRPSWPDRVLAWLAPVRAAVGL
jgi:hypothetical protein